MEKRYAGRLTISRVHSSHEGDYVEISLVDDTSHTQPVKIHVSLQAFAEALMGSGDRPCTFEWRPSRVGKIHETRKQIVPYHGYYRHGSAEERRAKADALAPFEVDGWRGNPSDLGNMHRSLGDGQYRVLFARYVDAPELSGEQGGGQ